MTTPTLPPEYDVVVVGAGPVGLLLAAELVLGGARTVLLDRLTAPDTTIKAGSINVASAELLGRRGLLDELRRAQAAAVDDLAASLDGTPGGGGVVAQARRGIRATHFAAISLDTSLADDDDPRLVGHTDAVDGTYVSQWAIEAVLRKHAVGLGVDVRQGVSFTGLAEHADGVTVETDRGPLQATWVVGCDGGRSAVRHAIGVEFPGTDPEITGRQGVVDLADDTMLRRGWNWSTRGVYCYGPVPGRVLTVEFDGPPLDRAAPVTADELQASLARVSGTDVTVTGLRGAATRWTDNARQAVTYRHGRVLLAGDAAHVHSPFSGQGLNLGLGDAMNLGWKLAAVVTGRSTVDLLEAYTAERHPVGEWVMEWTRAQIALMRPDVKTGALRDVAAELFTTREGMTHMVAEITGVDRRVLTDVDAPAVGHTVRDGELADGRPLREAFTDGRFVLVGPEAVLAPAWSGRVDVVVDGVGAGVTRLVRPDGVIAWAGDVRRDAAGLRASLDRWVGQLRSAAVSS